MKSIRVDPEVLRLARNAGETPNQGLRKLLGLPESEHNAPRRKQNRLVRAFKLLIKG